MSDYNSGENTEENTGESVKTEEITIDNKIKLDIGDTLIDGLNISLKNIGPILVNLLLWVLTIWIPYINVGTTIGMFSGIVIKASREETISYTEIFNPRYRKYMGDYFLTVGLIFMGVLIGVIFLIVPGIIISIAWGFALLFVVDKEKNPMDAIKLSHDITYGHKGRIFLISLILSVIFSIVQTVLKQFDNDFASFLIIIIAVFQIFVSLGIQASMYKQLAGEA
jgi:hypothetical protein